MLFLLACTDKSPPAETADHTGESEEVEASTPLDSESPGESAEESAEETAEDSEETARETDTSPPDTGDPPPPDPLLPDLTGYNLVIVHVDTLRADHLSAYGYARETLPNTGGEPWIVVDDFRAGAPWTFPSTANLLTGALPDEHGFTDDGGNPGTAFFELGLPTLAAHLGDQGWVSSAWSGNTWVTDLSDMIASFDSAMNIPKSLTAYNLQRSASFALGWIDRQPKGVPFFVFLQPMDMHLPYQIQPAEQGAFGDPKRPWSLLETDEDAQIRDIRRALEEDPAGATQALLDTYDECLLGLDLGLRDLLDGLQSRGLLETTVVVVAGDHGETLNDAMDADLGHGQTVREELLRVPLLVLVPGGAAAERTCLAENRDLVPTLLEAGGLPPMATSSGMSLQAGCREVTESSLWSTPDTLGRLTAMTDGQKLEARCDEGVAYAWDLDLDPAELTPVDPSDLPAVDTLTATLTDALARIQATYPKATCTW